jgi:hypothetical protein
VDTIEQVEQQKKAAKFWQAHFAQYIENPIDEQIALNIDFWGKLHDALESEAIDVVDAVIFSSVSINITTTEMYLRIVRTAKRIWDKKTIEM